MIWIRLRSCMTSLRTELRLPATLAALAAMISPRTIKSVGFSVPLAPGRLGVLWDTGHIVDRPDDCVAMDEPTAKNINVLSIVPAYALSLDDVFAIVKQCSRPFGRNILGYVARMLSDMLSEEAVDPWNLLLDKDMRLPVQYSDSRSCVIDDREMAAVRIPLAMAALGRLPFRAIVAVSMHWGDLNISVFNPGDSNCDHVYKTMSDLLITSLSACAKIHVGKSPFLQDIVTHFTGLPRGSAFRAAVELPEELIETIGGYDAEKGEIDKAQQETRAAAYNPVVLLLREAEKSGVPAGRLWRQACGGTGQQ